MANSYVILQKLIVFIFLAGGPLPFLLTSSQWRTQDLVSGGSTAWVRAPMSYGPPFAF